MFGPLDDEYMDGHMDDAFHPDDPYWMPPDRPTRWEAFIVGRPAPQGSKKHVGGGRMVEASKYVKAWRETVKNVGAANAPRDPMDGPLEMHVTFWIARPKSHSMKYRTWPTSRPDLSKLIRALEDGLVDAKVIHDDSRIIRIIATERYVHPESLRLPGEPDQAGAHVEVYTTVGKP